MSTHLRWFAQRANRPLTEDERRTLARLREDRETETDFRSFLDLLPEAFPDVTWHTLVETEARRFLFFEVDDGGVFSAEVTFSLHPREVEPPPRSADDDYLIAACTPDSGSQVARVIERAWEADGGALVVEQDRVRIPISWRSRRHAKWAFQAVAHHLLAPLAMVIDVARWRGEQLRREHYGVVLRSGGAVLRPVWLVVPDDDEWTEAAQLLLTGSNQALA